MYQHILLRVNPAYYKLIGIRIYTLIQDKTVSHQKSLIFNVRLLMSVGLSLRQPNGTTLATGSCELNITFCGVFHGEILSHDNSVVVSHFKLAFDFPSDLIGSIFSLLFSSWKQNLNRSNQECHPFTKLRLKTSSWRRLLSTDIKSFKRESMMSLFLPFFIKLETFLFSPNLHFLYSLQQRITIDKPHIGISLRRIPRCRYFSLGTDSGQGNV